MAFVYHGASVPTYVCIASEAGRQSILNKRVSKNNHMYDNGKLYKAFQ